MVEANWSEQVLIVGESHLSSIGKKILPASDTLKREPNDNEKIIVSGKDDLDYEIVLFEIHRHPERKFNIFFVLTKDS